MDPILAPVLLSILINDLHEEAEYSLSKLVNDIKLGGVVDMLGGHVVIQEDLNSWRNGLQFNRGSTESYTWSGTTTCTKMLLKPVKVTEKQNLVTWSNSAPAVTFLSSLSMYQGP